ncbi:MAG: right-handed parallel beta-helix repeat-containing protein [Prolixibacteraceae bacterium]|jgi:hypothetical protein|nr:right-handed parallel beta-helix repeat-containing protein [Prolixibacteraceae bacterium]
MDIRKIIIVILLSFPAMLVYTQPRAYHVSKEGNDNNSGTEFSPFKTIKKASGILKQGDSCIVHTGVYRECFYPANNGTRQNPIILMAAKGEEVTLSGMEPVNDWEISEGNIFKAKVPWTLGKANLVLIIDSMGIEARFPNKTNSDPFDPQCGEIIEEGLSVMDESEPHENPHRFLTDIIPGKWAIEDLKEAKVWVLAQHKWSAWIAQVLRYDNQKRALFFKPFDSHDTWVSSNHNPNFMNKYRGKNIFYLFGSKIFLDGANEWYYDKPNKELLLILPGGRKPQNGEVEFRRRVTAIDLHNKKFWMISGFKITGATINLSQAENCIIRNCHLKYFWHSLPAQSQFASNGNSGILMGGKNNTVQNSELSYSAGSGFTLSGSNNKVENNLIHHLNYIGSASYGALNTAGIGHHIVYNTIHSTGRDCIRLNNGGGHVIACNNIYNPGLICEDLGVVYSGGTDYENTQIHHNFIHNNNQPKQSVLGIYFDNFTNNGIAHHNIVWGIKEGVRMNRPGNYHQIYNNIIVEINNEYGPWQGPATQFGSAIVNNFTLNPIRANDEVFKANNSIGFTSDVLQLSSIKMKPPEGINKYGFPKYIGAFSEEKDAWTAGHDFNRTSTPNMSLELPFMRNYIENGSFEWQINRHQRVIDKGRIDRWKKSGAVELSFSAGFNIPGPDTRNAIYGNSCLLNNDSAGISQIVKGLRTDFPYKIGVYVRSEVTAEVVLSVQTEKCRQKVSSNDFPIKAGWKLLVLSFRTGKQDVEVKVQIRRNGKGSVYLDNIGMIPDLGTFEEDN